MTEVSTYRIKTVADFDQVPEDRLPDCLHDFMEYLEVRRSVSAFLRRVVSINDVFTWHDDGVRGVSSVRIVDKDTDEVVAEFKGRHREDSTL